MTVTGPFTVDMKPLETYSDKSEGFDLGRMSIDKTFEGPLEGKSQGEMLMAISPPSPSAGYVAIEKFIGTLEGKAGTFVLQHFGIKSAAGKNRLILEIVPDSGTGRLTGISGTMEINREDGKHSYTFYFEL